MTKKDFTLIASTLKAGVVTAKRIRAGDQADGYILATEHTVRRFALMLADTNDLFDSERFLSACGVDPDGRINR